MIGLTLDGGTGDDALTGSAGVDQLNGQDDNDDFIYRQRGRDIVVHGRRQRHFQWDPGDGNDIVEGQAGTDTLLFFGANIAENIRLSPTARACSSSAMSPTSPSIR